MCRRLITLQLPILQGRYLPVFSSEVVDKDSVIAEGRPTINLKGVLISNGIIDHTT